MTIFFRELEPKKAAGNLRVTFSEVHIVGHTLDDSQSAPGAGTEAGNESADGAAGGKTGEDNFKNHVGGVQAKHSTFF